MTSMLRALTSRVVPRTTAAAILRPSTPFTFLSHRLPLANNRALFAFAPRAISTSRILSQAATATADAADEEHHTKRGRPSKAAAKADHEPSSVSEYMDKFGGWYPLLGLGAVVLVSKELLVLNEELLMVTNFAAFVFISWLVAGDIVNDAVKEKAAALTKNHDDVSDLYIESLHQVIRAGENSLATLPLMRNLKEEFSSLGQQVVQAKEMKSRAAARDATIARLNAAYQKEQAEKAKYMTNLLDDVVGEVQERVQQLSEQDKEAIMESAIQQLSGQEQSGEDPLTRIYQEVLNSRMGGEDGAAEGEEEHEGQLQSA